jgi:hypothetical protein
MPLEISEIGVRMAVREPGEAPPPGGAASGGGGGGCGSQRSSGLTGPQHDALVEECVRNVLRALQMREAR